MGERPTWKNTVIRFKFLKCVPSKRLGHLENLLPDITVSASPHSILQALANKKKKKSPRRILILIYGKH